MIEVGPPPLCCYCGEPFASPADARPYGPGGALTCFACATKPENKATTEAQFKASMEAAERDGFGVATLTAEGVRPSTRAERVDAARHGRKLGVAPEKRQDGGKSS